MVSWILSIGATERPGERRIALVRYSNTPANETLAALGPPPTPTSTRSPEGALAKRTTPAASATPPAMNATVDTVAALRALLCGPVTLDVPPGGSQRLTLPPQASRRLP